MRCDDLDDLIEALAEGEAVPPEAEAHVAGCPRCQARVELSRAMSRLLLAREVPAPPDAFTQQVMRRVSQERWRIEQFVDAGFNAALVAGVLVVLGGVTGLLWSFGWLSVDVAVLSAASGTLAPWTTRVSSEMPTVVLAAVLLSSTLALWWWVEGGEAT